jgi:hypothetical protein
LTCQSMRKRIIIFIRYWLPLKHFFFFKILEHFRFFIIVKYLRRLAHRTLLIAYHIKNLRALHIWRRYNHWVDCRCFKLWILFKDRFDIKLILPDKSRSRSLFICCKKFVKLHHVFYEFFDLFIIPNCENYKYEPR